MKKIISPEDNVPTYINTDVASDGRFYKCRVDSTGYLPPNVQIRRMMLQGQIDDLIRLQYFDAIPNSDNPSFQDVEPSVFALKDFDNLERVELIKKRITNYNNLVSELQSKYGISHPLGILPDGSTYFVEPKVADVDKSKNDDDDDNDDETSVKKSSKRNS